MTIFTTIPDTNLEPGDPIRSVDIIALKDNTNYLYEKLNAADIQTFDASGTWTKPAINGTVVGTMVRIQVWGAGGSGGRGSNCGGGGGGGYNEVFLPITSLGATETVTIGAGGAARTGSNQDGAVGGNSSFGSHCTAYGGGGGGTSNKTGGGGGGAISAGSVGINIITSGSQNPVSVAQDFNISMFKRPASLGGDGGGGNPSVLFNITYTIGESTNYTRFVLFRSEDAAWGGGAGGSNGEEDGQNAVYGGGGGGANGDSGGVSLYGGNGGSSSSVNGVQPGGGGCASTSTSGSGGNGRVIVTVF